MLANRIDVDTMVQIIVEGLATATPRRFGAGREVLEVMALRITEAGRAVLAEVKPRGRLMRLLGSIRVDPEHWRERAEEARYVAKQMSDPVAREMMLGIAADYERLAEHVQRRVTQGDGKNPL